jgi:membrane protein implicated in regulation of membrane protease activity
MFLLILLTGCSIFSSETPPPNEPGKFVSKGPTPEEITKASVKQKSGTETIDTEASKIVKTTKENDTKKSAEIILDANKGLKDNITILIDTSTDSKAKQDYIDKQEKYIVDLKEHTDKKYNELLDKYNKLEDKHRGVFRMIAYFLYGLGGLSVAGGIFLLIRSGGGQWELLVFGLACVITGRLLDWIEAHFGYILIVIGVVVAYVVGRVYVVNRRATRAAVKACEQAKCELKAVAPERVEKLFGKYHTVGSVNMDETSKQIIAAERKKINEEWAPYVNTPKTNVVVPSQNKSE